MNDVINANGTSKHRCLIYDGAPSKQLDCVAPIIVKKLDANYRCLYLNSPSMVAGLRSYLRAIGLDLTKNIQRGSLTITSDQGHLVDGRFDVDGMLSMLKVNLTRALADGYVGLWATGDMTWEFGSHANLVKLLEYEHKLEKFLRENPAMEGICQYHRDTLPPHAILTALDTHESVYVNETLMHLNPFYRCHDGVASGEISPCDTFASDQGQE